VLAYDSRVRRFDRALARGAGQFRSRWRHSRRKALTIDFPQPGETRVGDAVYISGWAVAPGGVASVDVLVNEQHTRAARTGSKRSDVAAELGDPAAAFSGWWTPITPNDLVEGENVVRAIARQSSGAVIAETTRCFSWRTLRPGEVPYDQVDLSGERYDPGWPIQNSVAIEHQARYRLAKGLAAGRRVLDAGCGLGYGASELMAAGAKTVDAVDSSGVAIERARHAGDARVRFTIGDIRELPYADGAFDLIVCFEAIEHVHEHDVVFDEFRRTLAADGVLILSTPNRDCELIENPWHLRELNASELEHALRARFRNVALLRQQLYVTTVIGDESILAWADPDQELVLNALKLSGGEPGSEANAVALASDGELPATQPVTALGDARDELVDAAIAGWRQRAQRAEAEAAMLRHRINAALEWGAE